LSNGSSFGDAIQVAALSDSSGWNTEDNYLTLRTGDVNGDGAEDLCIRANANIMCFKWNGSSFDEFDGPAWSDSSNWNSP
jgi:hypothetical protein